MTTNSFQLQKEYHGFIQFYWKNGISNGHPTQEGVLKERVYEIRDEIDAFADNLSRQNDEQTLMVDDTACCQYEIVAFVADNEEEIDKALAETQAFLSQYSEIVPI
jgi:hypothetical protein